MDLTGTASMPNEPHRPPQNVRMPGMAPVALGGVRREACSWSTAQSEACSDGACVRLSVLQQVMLLESSAVPLSCQVGAVCGPARLVQW